MRPLAGLREDVVYTGHWLVFPRNRRYLRGVAVLAGELGLRLDLDALAQPEGG